MLWTYHKQIKIIPGVHLIFSKSGISTSIAVEDADNHRQPAPDDNIFSADVEQITSQNMQGIKEAMLMAHQQRKDLGKDLQKIKQATSRSKLKLTISYILLYGLINRSIAQNIRTDIQAQETAILQIQKHITHSCVSLEVQFEPEMLKTYNQVVNTFRQLMSSHKIWDVTSEHYQDRVAARSSAGTLVSKKEVRFGIKQLPDISSDFDVLYFQNANGSDLYFYPGFIVMHASKASFAFIGIDEIVFNYGGVRFTETGTIPRDSKVIDKTWAKVNKNGTPDKRFKSNYQIPVVRYGEISLKTNTGIHEEYECSNYEATQAFGQAFTEYQRWIKMLGNI